MAFLVSLLVSQSVGQGNQPQKPVPKAERERLFKAALKLDPIPDGAIEIELKRSIPLDSEIEEKEIFFRNAHAFSMDERGHIFIPEYYPPSVFEFDSEGKLFLRYNKKGQGPGELSYPNQVWFFDEQIVVCDGGSRRVNFYDRKWKFIRSFTCQKSYWNFVAGKNKSIYAVCFNDDHLIEIMNSKGEILISFGALPSKKGSAMNSAVVAISPAGSVWIGLASLGQVKKYSAEGSLQGEIDLMSYAGRKLKESLRQNLDWEKKGERKSSLLITGISCVGEDLFVQVGGALQPILRFDANGRYKAAYYIKPVDTWINYQGLCARLDPSGKEEFLIMRSDYDSDDKRVGVYMPQTAARRP